MAFFSIIIPTFNSEKTLKRSIDSVINQSFNDYEILIIDGCSSDNTINIVKEYSDNRIKWISEKDQGVYDAMNKGADLAKGEWLYFLGSDDYLLDNEVLMNVSRFINDKPEPPDIVYGNVNSPLLGDHYNGAFDIIKLCGKNICHQAIFYNRRVFQLVGRYNLRYKLLADYDYNLRCFFYPNIKVEYIELTIAYWSEGGISNGSNQIDEIFYNEKFDTIKRIGYKKLSFRQLKYFCNSNIEYLFLVFKKARAVFL